MERLFDAGQQVLVSQPFSRLLGTELCELSEGYAELSLQVRDDFKQSYGFVHGGVVSYLADNCLTFAGATVLGPCVTSEFKINYVMPTIGDRMVAKSTVLSFALRQAVCDCKVYVVRGQESMLVAVAQGTIVRIDTDVRDVGGMRAIVAHEYGSLEVLRLQDVDKPVPRPDELLVRVRAASVNAADGLLMHGWPYLMRAQIGWTRPRIKGLGLDFAGVVEAVGPAVTAFGPGDAVFGEIAQDYAGPTRAFAEYICVAASSVIRKPEQVSFTEAAAVPLAGCTALYAVRDHGEVGPGQHVLVNGAGGGVGMYAVQLAKHFGAIVTGVCSDGKAGKVREVGADRVIDYRRHDFTADSVKYDVIVDIASSQGVWRCGRVLAQRGRFVWVGGPASSRWLGPMRPALNVLLMSLVNRRQRWRIVAKSSSAEDVAVLAALLADGSLRPVIDRCYPLERAPEAIRHLQDGRVCGKVVIEI